MIDARPETAAVAGEESEQIASSSHDMDVDMVAAQPGIAVAGEDSSDSEHSESPPIRLYPTFDSPTVSSYHPDFWTEPFFTEVEHSWLRTGCILGVRNQGNTHACWAISTITVLYADLCINGDYAIQGSAQKLYDWVHRCGGYTGFSDPMGYANYAHNALAFVQQFGVYHESDYPWRGDCSTGMPLVSYLDCPDTKIYIRDFKSIPANDHGAILERLRLQPIVGGFQLGGSFCSLGREDIYQGITEWDIATRSVRNHAVVLVGFGGKLGIDDYFLCQNSGGPTSGFHGYFKIRRNLVFELYYPIDTHYRKELILDEWKNTNDYSRMLHDVEQFRF